MNPHSSITDLQKRVVQLYLKFEQRFRENALIRELWNTMAHDVSQQVLSLKALPPSFWKKMKADEDGSLEAGIQDASMQANENKEDISLLGCFELTVQIEEPTILKVYVPIIRSLRKNLKNPSLDFYIMVKAHLARIVRVIESFSGDPIIIQRSNMLMQSFEKEIQEPKIVIEHTIKKIRSRSASSKKKTAAKRIEKRKKAAKPAKPSSRRSKASRSKTKLKTTRSLSKQAKARRGSTKPKQARPLSKHAKIRHRRTKPLIKKVNLQRRRARR